jgi:hypothetical protein
MLGCRRHPEDPSRDDSRCPAAQDQDHSTTTSRADEVVWRRRPRRERLQTGGAVRWKRLLNLEAKDHHTGTVDGNHAQAGERRACPEERPEQPRPARGSPSEGVSRQPPLRLRGPQPDSSAATLRTVSTSSTRTLRIRSREPLQRVHVSTQPSRSSAQDHWGLSGQTHRADHAPCASASPVRRR